MLNINKRISLSKKSKRKIKKLKRKNGGFYTHDSWKDINKTVKNEISKKLFANQGYKCVYCERYLTGLGNEIDHFAHKGNHAQFTFITVNLFYSCKYCNSSSIKGCKDTIQSSHPYYNNCTFSIVHPFFDNPNNDIYFSDPDKVFLDIANCTQKGKDTIEFFKYDEIIMTNIRARILLFERLNLLTTIEEQKLIQASISYK